MPATGERVLTTTFGRSLEAIDEVGETQVEVFAFLEQQRIKFLGSGSTAGGDVGGRCALNGRRSRALSDGWR